jgi:hypothetical protein
MLQGAGVSGVQTQLLLVGVLGIVGLTGTVAGSYLTDHVRRRTQLITGTVMNAVLITIATVLNATNILKTDDGYVAKSEVTARAQIAMFYLFIFVFCVGWSAIQVLYPVECLRFETRAKGMSIYYVCLTFTLYIQKRYLTNIASQFINNLGQFYSTFVTGIAFSSIGWRYYFIFVAWNICTVFAVYFLFPETGKRTLEELADIFKSKSPVKTSLRKLV